MDLLIDWLLRPSIEAVAIVLLVFFVQAALGTRLPAAWRYGLWTLVFLRLAIPVLPASPWSLFQWTAESSAPALPGLGAWTPTLTEGVAAVPRAPIPWGLWLTCLWLTGFLVASISRLRAVFDLRQRLAEGQPIRSGRSAEIFATCRELLGLARDVELIESPAISGPAACGALRPRVVLPRNFARQRSDEELRHVLLHELTHVKRRDPLYLQVAGWAAAVHWFNPVLRWALGRLQDDCELACDAAVLDHLGQTDRSDYGRTLLRLTTARTVPRPALGITSRTQLVKRIQMISKYRPTSSKRTLFAALLLGILAVVSLTDAQPTSFDNEELEKGLEKQKKTIVDVRNIGSAMWTWLQEQPVNGEAESEDSDLKSIDWDDCPAISASELEAILVPTYLKTLLRTDPWGNDYEFCLDPSASRAHGLIGVRAAGEDGRFSGSTYHTGPFPAEKLHHDVVWQDGYFVNWPGEWKPLRRGSKR